MPGIKPAKVKAAESALLQEWKSNTVGGPADAIYPETIPGGIKKLWRKNVMGDCNNIYYALATSYFETDCHGPNPDNAWQRWAEVKASLRKYYVEALNDVNHERRRLYMHIEIESRWSLPNGLSGSLLKSLHTNDKSLESWTPYSVFQVMADYYDVEVVIFHTRLWTSSVEDINGETQTLKRLKNSVKEVICEQNESLMRKLKNDPEEIVRVEKEKALKKANGHLSNGINSEVGKSFALDLINREPPENSPMTIMKPVTYGYQLRRQLFLFSTSGRYGGTINVGTPNWPIDCSQIRWDEEHVMQYRDLVDEGKIEEDELFNKWRRRPCNDISTHPTEQEIAQVVCGVNIEYEYLDEDDVEAFVSDSQ